MKKLIRLIASFILLFNGLLFGLFFAMFSMLTIGIVMMFFGLEIFANIALGFQESLGLQESAKNFVGSFLPMLIYVLILLSLAVFYLCSFVVFWTNRGEWKVKLYGLTIFMTIAFIVAETLVFSSGIDITYYLCSISILILLADIWLQKKQVLDIQDGSEDIS